MYDKPVKTLKKAVYIGFGVTLFFLGLGSAVIFTFVPNIELGSKILIVASSLIGALFGWWSLRRGSGSVWDALSWLLIHLIP